MFGDLNKVQLIGNVTHDIDLKRTPQGTPLIDFAIATNRSYKDGDEWKESVTFHNITIWRWAENLAKKMQKGTRVYIEGRLVTESWESEGTTRYKTKIIAENIILLDRVREDSEVPANSDSSGDNTQSVRDIMGV